MTESVDAMAEVQAYLEVFQWEERKVRVRTGRQKVGSSRTVKVVPLRGALEDEV